MEKDDKELQEYLEFLNEMREEMSTKGLTSEELGRYLNEEKRQLDFWPALAEFRSRKSSCRFGIFSDGL